MSSGLPKSLNEFASWLSAAMIAWWAVAFYFLYGVLSSVQLVIWLLTGISVLCFLRYRSAWLAAPGARDYGVMVACWVIPGALSLFDPINPGTAFSTLGRLLSYGAMGLCLMRLQITTRQWSSTVLLLSSLLALWSLDGVIQAVFGTSLSGYPLSGVLPEGPKVTGSMGLDYGITLAVLSPLVFEAVRLHGAQRVSVWVALALVTVAVALSASRYSVLLFLFSGGLCLVLSMQLRRHATFKMLLVTIAVCLGGVLFPTLLVPTLSDRADLLLKGVVFDWHDLNQGFAFRPELWRAGWQVFTEHWINGVGLRGSPMALQPLLSASSDFPAVLQARLWHPHLGILEVMVDTGVIGLAAYLLMLVSLAQLISKSLQADCSQGVVFATIGLLAFLPVASTTSMYSFSLGSLAWPALALAVAALSRCTSDSGGQQTDSQ